MKTAFCWPLLIFALGGSAHGADVCDHKALARAASPFAYARHGVYCEGVSPGAVSGGMDVLSVTLGPIDPHGLKRKLPIQVRSGAGIDKLHLAVVTQSPTFHYRLDTELSPPLPFQWDAGPLASALSLRPNELGFLALRSPTGAVPVCVGMTAGECDAATRMYVIARPSSNLAVFDATVYRRHAVDWDTGKVLHLGPDGYPGGVPATVPISIQDRPDQVRIEFTGSRLPADAAGNTPTIDFATTVTINLHAAP